MTSRNDRPRQDRKPAAFRLDDARVRMSAEDDLQPTLAGETKIVPTREGDAAGLPAPERKAGIRWGRWFSVGLGGLVSLAIGLSVDALIRDLFSRNDWLGWLGLGLAAIAALGALGLVLREIFGILRLRHIESLRATFAQAAEADDQDKARAGIRELVALYGERPETARGRTALSGHMREIIDGRDLVVLAERDLLKELDARAVRIVKESVKRVSIVTAVSPRAALDLAIVLIENLRIMRRLSTLYGGRPGLIGFFRLARHVGAHLAMTGGMAAGDSLVSQLLGHGLAARLSARLGEGVVNGLLTARVGIAAIEVCRPIPFIGRAGPGISDVMGELFRADPEAKALLEKAEGRPQGERP
ncbi:YcjF family protein [Stappia sp. 28M-7]|jgi:putative membrane protein|uniref:YcjF family protein n=1 Tax=Stappia sp. 28M-7 TaxID=2762596 RepID=UPI00163C4048|nr:TIGR01620 family protein [Stappia sp. 28M-7]MBC2860348.1 TIGR01620 family protein [Stappia sp. 28M-7]